MAIQGGTQLFSNKNGTKINPITDAKAVTCGIGNTGSSVYEDVQDLYKQISDLTGDDEAVNNIKIEVHYRASQSKDVGDVLDDQEDKWVTFFTSPNSTNPYTWKRTSISYKGGEPKLTYEIVASMDAEVTQTIYRAVSAGETADIDYKNPETGRIDYTMYNNGSIPEKWSTTPVGITAAAPDAYMSNRTKKDGKWGMFSTPVQYGRWAYDSKIEMRYQVTSNSTPPAIYKEDKPNELTDDWKITNNTIFTGFLWMISAMSVGNELQSYDGVIWHGPNLLSIVK